MRAPALLLIALAMALQGCNREPGGAIVGNAEAGRVAFAKCASCHKVGPYARGGFGPQLNGIVGRRAGSTSDYAYSAAMKNADFVWNEARLTAFLRDPDALVPGNSMRFRGIRDEREIADLVAYLRDQAPM